MLTFGCDDVGLEHVTILHSIRHTAISPEPPLKIGGHVAPWKVACVESLGTLLLPLPTIL